PGLERLYANGLAAPRSRIMGHHLWLIAFSSVTSMRILHSHDGVHQRVRWLATEPANALRGGLVHPRVTSDKPLSNQGSAKMKFSSGSNDPTNALKNARIERAFKGTQLRVQRMSRAERHILSQLTTI